MSRYRLYPTPQQADALLRHCADARFVWNLCVEQQSWWRRGRVRMPGFAARCRQLTEARADNPWLAKGSVIVQQQAIKDYDVALRNFFGRSHGHPSWRKAGRDEGFRIVGKRGQHWDARRLNRNNGEIYIAKVGWIRFRWSRPLPEDVKSFRVTFDPAGRWHVGFAVTEVPAVAAPGNGEVVGIDRGIAVSAALSTGEMLHCPGLSARETCRLERLQRKLRRAKAGSNRRGRVKRAITKLHARGGARRRDWCEKTSTDLARRFDVIRVENLPVGKMTRRPRPRLAGDGTYVRNGAAKKATLNRGISHSAWSLLVERLEDKAPGRVEKVPAAYTSQRCSACGLVDRESRESQARFRCTACGFACNADVNAAMNIAAGHAVKARGGPQLVPVNREPQLPLTA